MPEKIFDGACQNTVKFYCFPRSRLNVVDAEGEEKSKLELIEERLDDRDFDYEKRNGDIVVNKFGEHIIHDNGLVEGPRISGS